MNQLLLHILVICYACIAIVDIIAYIPTLRDLYAHRKPSGNLTSYFLWTYSTGISFLYSVFVLSDTLFRVVSGTLFTFNFIVLLLLLRLRFFQAVEVEA